MPSTYAKPHKSYEEQLYLLMSRGLIVTDQAMALDYLSRIGYYRLSAYWYSFRKFKIVKDEATQVQRFERDDAFQDGTTFQNVLDLYVFDKKLRLLMLDAIERIEVSVRVDIAYALSERDIFAHEKPQLLDTKFVTAKNVGDLSSYDIWIKKHLDLVMKSKETFVKHFKSKYGDSLPIWVSIELWDFGMLSKFYEGMRVADKRRVAQTYELPHQVGQCEDWQLLQSWLRSINFVRNVVAHHSRLWNKNLVDLPKLPRKGMRAEFDPIVGDADALTRPYVVLCLISYMLRKICPQSSWQKRMVELADSFPVVPGHSLEDMGFPKGWKAHQFWT